MSARDVGLVGIERGRPLRRWIDPALARGRRAMSAATAGAVMAENFQPVQPVDGGADGLPGPSPDASSAASLGTQALVHVFAQRGSRGS